MARFLKITDTKGIRITLIQMGENIKGEPDKPVLLSLRSMYCTAKEPGDWKPGYAGFTFDIGLVARVIAGITAVIAKGKIEIIEPKDKKADKSKTKKPKG